MDIKILVAAHKKYWMPSDDVYMPLHVGAEGKEPLGYTPDNTGDWEKIIMHLTDRQTDNA